MNGLSWIIYGAEVAGGVKALLEVTAIFVAISTVAAALFIFSTTDWSWDSLSEKDRKDKIRASGKRWVIRLPIIAVFLGIISILIPSKPTLYLIGASQAGEQIVQLQEVQEIGGEAGALASDTIKLLRQMVSDQLEGTE